MPGLKEPKFSPFSCEKGQLLFETDEQAGKGSQAGDFEFAEPSPAAAFGCSLCTID